VKPLVKLFFISTALAFCAIPALHAQREKLPPEDLEFVEKNWPEAKKTTTGIRYIIMREGQGDTPKPGDKVNVLYVGRLLNGKVFDQATDATQPFTFRVRREAVIEGWDQILQLMKRGEKRLVIVPPELAYGTRGQPPKIGRNQTLVFEIELLSFGKD
jgi:FKBP-type peptidyl-prolyl cis-trans isomerase